MTGRQRHLGVAPEPRDDGAAGYEARRRIAESLRSLAAVAERHAGYTVGGVTHGPPRAALVVLFDVDGRPHPHVSGDLANMTWATWVELLADANTALRDYGMAPGTDGRPPTAAERHAYVDAGWEAREGRRVDHADRVAAEREARRFPCECGFRARSEGGLVSHRRGSAHRARMRGLGRTDDHPAAGSSSTT